MHLLIPGDELTPRNVLPADAALTLPKHFKRHAEQAVSLLQQSLETVAILETTPEPVQGYADLVFDIEDTVKRLALAANGRKLKTVLRNQPESALEEIVGLVCVAMEAFSCILQGLSSKDTLTTNEEYMILLPTVITCMKVTSANTFV